ncbi:4-hydroxy-tetrahydrodipicolinate synthase [Streptomyces armeniacus]|uniref:4-hydroxy-tetrahydrodipicolinate synthase n=1 Tax=Streptomyces armeniacus TaxID=83291 RepID=A0A345Y029_9ACTN|nr:4-hydroxy-tetrahydrodipicolinate synthase [Streptomyces armeniacus]AXK37245.1 4-hydroxy-tetrahydrodipicolinate synthase [Streptomyces armeniacus]
MSASPGPFGRINAAMITPFDADGALDPEGAARLAARLVDEDGCDGLVVSGTTGESPTTSDEEKTLLVRTVVEAVGDRATVTAGVGSSDTRHSAGLARAAERAGAHGLLVVTPYYSRPGQPAVVHHLREVADATGLPVLLYDIPARTGTALSTESLLRLAEHPRIQGVKDCSYDPLKAAKIIGATGLSYYSGCDELILPLRSIGAVGCVSSVANVAGRHVRAMLDAFDAGDHTTATRLHLALVPLVDALMSEAPYTVTLKALLAAHALPSGPLRAPLLPADDLLTTRVVEAFKQLTPAT